MSTAPANKTPTKSFLPLFTSRTETLFWAPLQDLQTSLCTYELGNDQKATPSIIASPSEWLSYFFHILFMLIYKRFLLKEFRREAAPHGDICESWLRSSWDPTWRLVTL
jgi:hypothetical protein